MTIRQKVYKIYTKGMRKHTYLHIPDTNLQYRHMCNSRKNPSATLFTFKCQYISSDVLAVRKEGRKDWVTLNMRTQVDKTSNCCARSFLCVWKKKKNNPFLLCVLYVLSYIASLSLCVDFIIVLNVCAIFLLPSDVLHANVKKKRRN